MVVLKKDSDAYEEHKKARLEDKSESMLICLPTPVEHQGGLLPIQAFPF